MSALIGIVGNFNPSNRVHLLTTECLHHVGLRCEWVPTEEVPPERPQERLASFEGIWSAPASPYRSMEGALAAIRYARERGVPLVGT